MSNVEKDEKNSAYMGIRLPPSLLDRVNAYAEKIRPSGEKRDQSRAARALLRKGLEAVGHRSSGDPGEAAFSELEKTHGTEKGKAGRGSQKDRKAGGKADR